VAALRSLHERGFLPERGERCGGGAVVAVAHRGAELSSGDGQQRDGRWCFDRQVEALCSRVLVAEAEVRARQVPLRRRGPLRSVFGRRSARGAGSIRKGSPPVGHVIGAENIERARAPGMSTSRSGGATGSA
jgi:hypothetical protein